MGESMKLTKIISLGRYINPSTGRAVNVKRGRRVGRSVDVMFYLYRQQRVFICDAEFSAWVKA